MLNERICLAGAAVAIALAIVPASAQQVVAGSSFGSDSEGWTVRTVVGGICSGAFVFDIDGTVEHRLAGGAPDGFLRHGDTSGDRTSMFRAPAPFRGDLSAAVGGSISFARRTNSTDPDYYQRYDDVHILSPAGRLFGNVSRPPIGSWGVQRLEFLRGFWRLDNCWGPVATEDQILAVLSDVTDMYIVAEYINGGESNDLDEVRIEGPRGDPLPAVEWALADDAVPSARWHHAMAVDTHRNVLVLFGGDSGETDTWEFDLSTEQWSERVTATAPSRVGGHAMAYDAARRRVVLTGGQFRGVARNEVWEYDGVAGSWAPAAPLPEPRTGHSMAYDTLRNTMVLYGGVSNSDPGEEVVLERSAASSTWQARAADTNPDTQFGHAMAYDQTRQRTVLVGQGTTNIEVWEWNGLDGTWTLRNFAGSVPARRNNPAIAFDAARSRIVLIGGQAFRSTWDYDGTAWTFRGNMPSANTGKDEHAVAYDPVRARVLSYGGFAGDGFPVRSLTAFDGAANTWSFVTFEDSPAPRYWAPAAFDEATGRSILYGGRAASRPGQDDQISQATFAFDGTQWDVVDTNDAAPNAGPVFLAPMAYDPTGRQMLLYGGLGTDAPAGTLRDVWSFDVLSDSWNNLTPPVTTPPGQRSHHAAAFDRNRGRLVVFGGQDETEAVLGDTWEYNPSTGVWVQVAVAAATPSPRAGAAMTFDERRGVCVLFGGRGGPTGDIYDESTWEWNGTSWIDVTPPGLRPRGRREPGFVYDPSSGLSVLMGGNFHWPNDTGTVNREYDFAPQMEDMWAYDGSAWRPVLQEGELPVARWLSSVVFDRARGRIITFGGAALRTDTGNERTVSGQTWVASLTAPIVCPADINSDGSVNFADVQAFVLLFAALDLGADIDGNGVVNFADVQAFAAAFNAGC